MIWSTNLPPRPIMPTALPPSRRRNNIMVETTQDQTLDRDRPAGTADLAAAGNSTESLVRQESERGEVRQDAGEAPLFPESEAGELRRRWDSVQASFVDEPRRAVEQADELVANAMK